MLDKSNADIAQNIAETDEVLNSIIQEFLDGAFYSGEPITVEQWRLENSLILRKWAYPPIEDFIDAQVKIKFKAKYKDNGDAQLDGYLTLCEQIKIKFPKEE